MAVFSARPCRTCLSELPPAVLHLVVQMHPRQPGPLAYSILGTNKQESKCESKLRLCGNISVPVDF